MKNGDAKQWVLKCEISMGMFSGERSVDISLPDGRTLTLLVDSQQVISGAVPKTGAKIPGQLKVAVLAKHDNKVLVDLPQPALAVGSRIEVPSSYIQVAA